METPLSIKKTAPPRARPAARPLARATVAPILPYALLEQVRLHDRPREVLEDEDLATSLPRRLGLTGVIESQILRYEDAVRRGQPIAADEVGDLLRLVLRRPDGEAILHATGGEVARRTLGRPSSLAASTLRLLPRAVLFAATRRTARRVLRRVLARGRLEVSGRPPAARITSSFTAQVDASGTACALYAGILEELVFLRTRWRPRVEHARCESRGDNCCEWVLAESQGTPGQGEPS